MVAQGWNTWDKASLVSFTHLPEGFTINLALKEYRNASIMRSPLLYKSEQKITLGAHSDDGSYSDMELECEQMKFRIQSGKDANNLVILITPMETRTIKVPVIIAEAGIVWQLPGTISKTGENISLTNGKSSTSLLMIPM